MQTFWQDIKLQLFSCILIIATLQRRLKKGMIKNQYNRIPQPVPDRNGNSYGEVTNLPSRWPPGYSLTIWTNSQRQTESGRIMIIYLQVNEAWFSLNIFYLLNYLHVNTWIHTVTLVHNRVYKLGFSAEAMWQDYSSTTGTRCMLKVYNTIFFTSYD